MKSKHAHSFFLSCAIVAALLALVPLRAQPTKQWSQGDPTADEQYALEVINRVRRDPVGAVDFYNVLETVKPVLKAAIATNTYRPNGSAPLSPEASFRAYVQLQLANYTSAAVAGRTPPPKPPLALYLLFTEQAEAQGTGLVNGATPTFPTFDAADFFNSAGASLPSKVVPPKLVPQFGFTGITAPVLSGSNGTGGTAATIAGFAPGGGPQNFSRGQLLFVANYYDALITLREVFATSGLSSVFLDDSFVTNTGSTGAITLRGKTRMVGINLSPARAAAPGSGSRVLSVFATDNEAFQTSDLPFGADTVFITGVVYRDADQDGDYTPGEGISGVTITPSAGNWFAVTSTSGGYAIPVAKNSGVYTLTAKGNGIDQTFIVSVDGDSVKADFVSPDTTPAPTITSQPLSQTPSVGLAVNLATSATAAAGAPAPIYQWQLNGRDLDDTTAAAFSLANVRTANLSILSALPWNTGLYTAVASSGAVGAKATSSPAIIGLGATNKVFGAGAEIGSNIKHPNGNIYDQVLVGDASANPLYCAVTVSADPGQVTRSSYVDLNNDIVQVEFSGAGTLTLVIDNASVPSPPVNYNQSVNYVKGYAHIVIAGADDTTNVSVFSVGRANAFDPTGAFNMVLPITAANNPANNGSTLFQGHASTSYDGVADLGYIAIQSNNGKFGGIFAGNAHFAGARGLVGVYAPGVQFVGPVVVGDITGFDAATAVLRFGATTSVKIAGGSLAQSNGLPVQVSGIAQMTFVDGATSQNDSLPAQTIKTRLYQNGTDVTTQLTGSP